MNLSFAQPLAFRAETTATGGTRPAQKGGVPNYIISRHIPPQGLRHIVVLRNPPKDKDTADYAREVGRALTSLTPVVGGVVQVVFENVLGPSLEKRRQEWAEELVAVINELQAEMEDLTPEKLATNEAFVTVTLQATQIAVRNHQEEKLQALRNAVANSARPNAPSDDEQLAFLRLVDSLTPWGIRLLMYLHDPGTWMVRNKIQHPGLQTASIGHVLEHAFPDMRRQREFYGQILRELQAAGLIVPGEFLNRTMSGRDLYQRLTTARGLAFIMFITKPSWGKVKEQ